MGSPQERWFEGVQKKGVSRVPSKGGLKPPPKPASRGPEKVVSRLPPKKVVSRGPRREFQGVPPPPRKRGLGVDKKGSPKIHLGGGKKGGFEGAPKGVWGPKKAVSRLPPKREQGVWRRGGF